MHTILVLQGPNLASVTRLAGRAAVALERIPSGGRELKVEIETFAESCTAWVLVEPAGGPFLQRCVGSDHAALVFGTVENTQEPARAVLEAWRGGGVSAVSRLEGLFSAVIVDRTSGRLLIAADSLGNLRFYYKRLHDGVLAASPHDASLAATGEAPLELDQAQVIAMLARHWSPGGRSLIRSVDHMPPGGVLSAKCGRFRVTKGPELLAQSRIDERDTAALGARLDELVESFRETVAACMNAADEVVLTLSAGVDSRAVLAAARASARYNRARGVSTGDPRCQDVLVAKQLAGMTGIGFRNPAFAAPNIADFERNARLFAFAMNGDLCESGHLLQPLTNDAEPVVLFGTGGELYRGRSRGGIAAYQAVAPGSISAVDCVGRQADRAVAALPTFDSELASPVRQRILETVVSAHPFDALDMYYMRERLGVWAKQKARQTWRRYKVPFMWRNLVEGIWALPTPIGEHAKVHGMLIRRYLPEALRIPINGGLLVELPNPDLRHGIWSAWALGVSFMRRARGKAIRSAARVSGKRLSFYKGRIQERHKLAFQRELAGYMDSLGGTDTVGCALFGKGGVNELLAGGDLKTFVQLTMLENWKSVVQELTEAAHSAGEAQASGRMAARSAATSPGEPIMTL